MLHICDQVVFLPQEALGNGKLHGIPGGHILVRRLWAGGNLAASLKKDFTARSKNRGSRNKPWGDVSFKGKHAKGETVLLCEVCLSPGHEELQKPKTKFGAMEEQMAQMGSYSGQMSSFLLKTLPEQYFYFHMNTFILFAALNHRMK